LTALTLFYFRLTIKGPELYELL